MGKLEFVSCELRRGALDSILVLMWHRGDVTLRSFLLLFRIVRQSLRACSSGMVWVETMASPPAAGAANPSLLSAIFSPMRGLKCVFRPQSGK